MKGWAAAVLAGLAAAGCARIEYYAQAVGGHLDLMARREPVAGLVADGRTPERLRERLARVAQIRDFSVAELALPDNGSYRSYADLEREYAVWTVVAAPALSLTPERWCFPVAGCVSYRGYFSEAAARKFAEGLRREGLDVYVAGVRAYSTLGWFDDPVLNTMLDDGESYVAGVVFHELAHQRLYVAGDSAFNEAFATTVEREGVRRWLARHGSPEARAAYARATARREQFVDLVLDWRARLLALYASDLGPARKHARKAELYAGLAGAYRRLRAAWGEYPGYDGWFAEDLNNAKLASVATYHRLVPAFRALLGQAGGDLAAFYAACERLGALERPDREAAMAALTAGEGTLSATVLKTAIESR